MAFGAISGCEFPTLRVPRAHFVTVQGTPRNVDILAMGVFNKTGIVLVKGGAAPKVVAGVVDDRGDASYAIGTLVREIGLNRPGVKAYLGYYDVEPPRLTTMRTALLRYGISICGDEAMDHGGDFMFDLLVGAPVPSNLWHPRGCYEPDEATCDSWEAFIDGDRLTGEGHNLRPEPIRLAYRLTNGIPPGYKFLAQRAPR